MTYAAPMCTENLSPNVFVAREFSGKTA
jgi:hypothetical protein